MKIFIDNLTFKFYLFFVVVFGIVVFVCLPAGTVLASATDGTISGYAWSGQIGWVNFGTTHGGTRIKDNTVTGYAWNENVGRINLNPTNSGVVSNDDGNLSGRAWSEGTGWINFSGVDVKYSGVFKGTATGDNSVSISFDCTQCNVTTDWRPVNSFKISVSAGSAESARSAGGGPVADEAPRGPLSISINNGAEYTNNPVVKLSLEGGPDSYEMMISNFSDFLDSVKESYQKNKTWILKEGDGLKTVYVKFYTNSGTASQPISDNIILDTLPPQIKITSIKNEYSTDEDIIIKGTTESKTQISLFFDDRYGTSDANQNGNWLVNFGKVSLGFHHLELTPKDSAGNIGKTVSADFSVAKSQITLAPPLVPIFRELAENVKSLIPQFFQPIEKKPPAVVVTVPKIAPIAFKGSFNYIQTILLSRFALAPLPSDVKLLTQKFPQLQRTFQTVGVRKIKDIEKLIEVDFKLPGLTEAILPEAKIRLGKFSVPRGIPIEGLSATGKIKIPSAVVFAKTGGGLVDFNNALSINDKGEVEQKIETITGHPLQLVVRVDKPVKKVVGYVVFKSKQYNKVSYQVSLNSMTASLLFANPNFTAAAKPKAAVQVEGKTNIKQRLVLSQFEYKDSGDDVYTAEIQAPLVDGEYEIITVMEYQDAAFKPQEMKLITVVDPEGYVYEKNGDLETRLKGAIVSLYWLNPELKQYELWSAGDFQQENPQITNVRGTYSFLVPNGYYYLKVDVPGYLNYDGKPFEIKEGSGVHINIELKRKYWLLKTLDWKTILLVVFALMLLYNFYQDKARAKST